ncbi:MAG: phage tail protein [Aurantimonas endophytica]|uniref:phage tail protein n=1 Tax=Aurantimonas endophytica TaxID=1522175 RepID=UPI003002261C
MPQIAPLIGAVFSAFAGVASFVSGLGIVGQALLGIGLNFAVSALRGDQKKEAVSGTQLQVQYGADRPREVAVGLVAVAGHDVYTNTYGPSNKYMQKVFVLSDFPITNITRIAVNGEWRTINWSNVEGRGAQVLGFENDVLRIRAYDGRHTELQAAEFGEHGLVGSSNPAGRWTAEHVGKGTAFVVINARFDDEEMSSLPQFLFEFQAAPLYDVRKDTTAGGSGSHRWDNVATWEYSENPIIQAYNYERGFFANGQLLVGKGVPAADLPAAPWMSAANVCDESTPTRALRYRAGALFSTSDGVTHSDNLAPVLEACSGGLFYLVDGDHPIVGANQPVVATLTDDDIIVGSPRQFRAKRSRSDLVNTVFGTYNSPDDLWAATSYDPPSSTEALAADRERHAKALNFSAVFIASQASDLAEAALRRSRYQASETIIVRPRWIVLEPGDWISLASERYGTRTYQVVGRSLGPLNGNGARNVTLTLDEVGNGIYDSSIVIPERPPRISPGFPVRLSTLQGFTAYASQVTNADGRALPAITVQWNLIDDVTVDAVLIEYWKTDDPSRRIQATFDRMSVSGVVAEGLVPRTSYTLQGTVVTNPARNTFFSAPQTVTTLNEDLAAELADLQEDVQEILRFGPESLSRFESLLEELAANIATTNVVQHTEAENASASLFEERTTRATETEALARRTDGVEAELTGVTTRMDGVETQVTGVGQAVTTLEGRVVDVEGDITVTASAVTAVESRIVTAEGDIAGQADALNSLNTAVTWVAGNVEAQADLISGVQATVDGVSSSGLFRTQVVSGDGVGTVRMALIARVNTSSSYVDSGIYIDVAGGVGSVLIRADRFIVTDGSASTYPFVIQGGVVKLAIARFQQLVSDNGKMVIDGSGGTISIYD